LTFWPQLLKLCCIFSQHISDAQIALIVANRGNSPLTAAVFSAAKPVKMMVQNQ
jgi:hypothetical protein